MLKLIKAIDLQHWADSKESEGLMPELMRRLIHASITDIVRISFPNEDCIDLPGFDGVLEYSSSSSYIPSGKVAFEIGTSQEQKHKADGDYNKRTENISEEERAITNFIFVIPRKWKSANDWERKRNEEGKWKSVRVLTDEDSEVWLEKLCLRHKYIVYSYLIFKLEEGHLLIPEQKRIFVLLMMMYGKNRDYFAISNYLRKYLTKD